MTTILYSSHTGSWLTDILGHAFKIVILILLENTKTKDPFSSNLNTQIGPYYKKVYLLLLMNIIHMGEFKCQDNTDGQKMPKM